MAVSLYDLAEPVKFYLKEGVELFKTGELSSVRPGTKAYFILDNCSRLTGKPIAEVSANATHALLDEITAMRGRIEDVARPTKRSLVLPKRLSEVAETIETYWELVLLAPRGSSEVESYQNLFASRDRAREFFEVERHSVYMMLKLASSKDTKIVVPAVAKYHDRVLERDFSNSPAQEADTLGAVPFGPIKL
jgi:hypothetical protein